MGKLARDDGDGTRREDEEKNAGGTKERNSASENERGTGSRGYVFLADYRSRLKHRLLLQQLEVRLRLIGMVRIERWWNLLFRSVADGGETAQGKNRRDGDTGGAAEDQSTERGHATHGGTASDAFGADRGSGDVRRVGLEESLKKEREEKEKKREKRGG